MTLSPAQLRAELDDHKVHLATLSRMARDDGRDLNRTELDTIDRIRIRSNEIAGLISHPDEHAERGRAIDANAAVNRSLGFGRDVSEPVARNSLEHTVGTYAFETGRMMLGRIGNQRFRQYADGELGRVVAHGVAADGTAPVTIEGDIVSFIDGSRPAVNASRQLPMPDNHAPTFKRPRISQHTTVAGQASEGDVLSSQRLQNTGDTITKLTRGGVLSLSEQEIDFTTPEMLGLALVDLADSYAIDTDNVLCDAIEAAFTASVQTVVSNTATAAVFTTAVATSAAAVYASSKSMPDTLFVAPDRWAYLAGLTDTTGRVAFPITGALNAPGTNVNGVGSFSGMNVLGLRVVVDANLTAGVWGTAVSKYVEWYELNKGILQIQVPSTLELQVAIRGYVAASVYTQGVNALETS